MDPPPRPPITTPSTPKFSDAHGASKNGESKSHSPGGRGGGGPGSNRLSVAGQSNEAHMQAQVKQALHSTCKLSCQRQRSQTSRVRRSVPVYARKRQNLRVGGWASSCKNEKQNGQCKGSNLQSGTIVQAETAAVPATDSLHQNFNTAYRGSNGLSVPSSQMQHTCKHRSNSIAFHMQTKVPTLIRANARIIAHAMQTSGENLDE